MHIWELFFLFLNQNIYCGYSKEPSQWDRSFEHPKHMFQLMDKKIITMFHSKYLLMVDLCFWSNPMIYRDNHDNAKTRLLDRILVPSTKSFTLCMLGNFACFLVAYIHVLDTWLHWDPWWLWCEVYILQPIEDTKSVSCFLLKLPECLNTISILHGNTRISFFFKKSLPSLNMFPLLTGSKEAIWRARIFFIKWLRTLLL